MTLDIFCGYTPWSFRVMRQFPGYYVIEKDYLDRDLLNHLKPRYVFFLHWSWIVPKEITNNFKCVNFHASDLPKFRGGHPIQNQIKRGITKTKLTAHYMTDKLDAGDILLQRDLDLSGSLDDIFWQIENLCPQMIRQIQRGDFTPRKQVGEPTFFKRADAN